MINHELALPQHVLSEDAKTKIWVQLRNANCDFYARTIHFQCEVYTLIKATDKQTIAPGQFWVTNTSYRAPILNAQGNPLTDAAGKPLEIGNFDYIYKRFFEETGLKQAAEAAMIAHFTGAKNPLPAFVQK